MAGAAWSLTGPAPDMTCLAAPHAGTRNGLYVVDREDGRELAHISGEKQTLDVKFLAISSQQEVRAVSHQCQQWLCGTCSVEHSAGSVEVTEHLVPCMCGAVLCHLCAVSPVCCVTCVLCHLCAVSPVRCVTCALCHLCVVSSVFVSLVHVTCLQIWCGTEPSREVRPLFVYDPNRFSKKHEFSDLSEWVNVILATDRQVRALPVCMQVQVLMALVSWLPTCVPADLVRD